MKRIIILSVSLLVYCLNIQAQDDLETRNKNRERLLEKVETQRIAFITNKLDLSSEESIRFWPIYNEYSKKRMELKRLKRSNKIEQELNEKESQKLLDEQLAAQEKELDLKLSYYTKFKTILPAQKLAKLEEAENEFNREILKRLRERRDGMKKRK